MSRLSILPGRAVTDERLSPVQFRLLALLCTYTNSEDHSCFPSQGLLAERLNLSRQYVNKVLGELEVLGYVEKRERKRSDGGVASNLYEVLYDEPDTTPCQQELTPPATPSSRQPLSTTGVDSNNVSSERLNEDSSGKEIEEAVNEYQLIAEQIGLSKIVKLSEGRRKHLKARLAEHGIETWRAAMRRVPASAFLSGKNDRRWRPDFDWFVKPTNFLKLIEGKYHDGKPVAASGELTLVQPSVPRDAERERWVARLKAWADSGYWTDDWGPAPGDPRCEAPRDLVDLHRKRVTA